MNDVVDHPNDLTPEWLSATLGRPVRSVRAERIGTGQIGSCWRLELELECDGDTGPDSLVAKLAAGDEAARARLAVGFRKEVGFYTQVASGVAALLPRCWYGAITDDGLRFTLLLEDLAPATPGVQVDGCTPAQAVAALRSAAALHASRWNDPTLLAHDFLAPPDPATIELIGAVFGPATETFVERYASHLGGDDVTTLREVVGAMVPWLSAQPDPFALVHTDYRLENLMFRPDGEVVVLDWQSVGAGAPGRDVAYFLGTSFEAIDRRQHEHELVARYHGELVTRGVRGYDRDRCFADYRAGHLQGPLTTVLGAVLATGASSEHADRMFAAMATRSCAAIRDLGSLELVGSAD